MKLVKEIAFGKAIARVTVEKAEVNKNFEGYDMGTETEVLKKVEIVKDGKVVLTSDKAIVYEYNAVTDVTFDRMGLDRNKKYTKIDKAFTEGAETAIAINEAMDEMEKELTGTNEKEQEEQEEIEVAETIVKMAEKEGIENLMTEVELKAWRKCYNDIQNEGGEGYIPTRISKEWYEKAKQLLSKRE